MTIWMLIVVILAALACIRILPENQRLAILRSGQVVGVRGPGIVFLIPTFEKGVRVDLDRDIPGWRSVPEERLLEQIRLHVKL